MRTIANAKRGKLNLRSNGFEYALLVRYLNGDF